MYKLDFGRCFRTIYQILVVIVTYLLAIEIYDSFYNLTYGVDTIRALMALILNLIYNLVGTLLVAAYDDQVEHGLFLAFFLKAAFLRSVIRTAKNFALVIFELSLLITMAAHLILQYVKSYRSGSFYNYLWNSSRLNKVAVRLSLFTLTALLKSIMVKILSFC